LLKAAPQTGALRLLNTSIQVTLKKRKEKKKKKKKEKKKEGN